MKLKANQLKIGMVLKSGETITAIDVFKIGKVVRVALQKNNQARVTIFGYNSTIFLKST